jgi:hypothetical protein
MKKILVAFMAVLALGVAPVFAQPEADADAAVGGTAGGAGGAALGFVFGGPLGAVVGGFTGAVIGAEAGVSADTVQYAAANPVEPVYLDNGLELGLIVPADVTIYPVEGDPQFGYIYANNRVWIVDMNTRALVQSPGYLVPQASADFAIANPVDPVGVTGDVVVGYVVPDDVELVAVPDDPTYSYVYVNDRPALVDNSTRTIVWIE